MQRLSPKTIVQMQRQLDSYFHTNATRHKTTTGSGREHSERVHQTKRCYKEKSKDPSHSNNVQRRKSKHTKAKGSQERTTKPLSSRSFLICQIFLSLFRLTQIFLLHSGPRPNRLIGTCVGSLTLQYCHSVTLLICNPNEKNSIFM